MLDTSPLIEFADPRLNVLGEALHKKLVVVLPLLLDEVSALIEVLGVEFPYVPYKVFVDDFVSDFV